jgi:serine/threonine-protein kinase
MGRVYRAVDTRTGADVAVKVLQAQYADDPTAAARLQREAQVIGALDSTHVVHLLDAGLDGDRPFLVMEYVPGPTLAEELRRRGSLSVEEALAVMLDVARGMEVAHARGIVHRDLKPGNIKLVEGRAKILDFGIARAVGDRTLTVTGMYVGTPAYSAPERADGKGDIRSDIYSAGLILYTTLAGRPPFIGANPFAVLNAHKTLPVPPLPAHVPAAVQQLVDRCLEKDPANRFQTPSELVVALEQVGATARRWQPPSNAMSEESVPAHSSTPDAPAGSDDATLAVAGETLGMDPQIDSAEDTSAAAKTARP